MSRVTSAEFVGLTGCTLAAGTITYILDAADRDVNTELTKLGNPTVSDETLEAAALLFAKCHLTDRNRFDGTFDVSTNEYSHKGNTEAMISGMREEAKELIRKEARTGMLWIQKANR